MCVDTIGERIHNSRVQLGLNQRELCEKAGITVSALSRYESGQREPKATILARLATSLNVSTDYLLALTNFKSPHYEEDLNSIENILKNTRQLLDKDELTFNGLPASKEVIDSILKALRIGLLVVLED